MNVSQTNQKPIIVLDELSNLTPPHLESDARKYASYTKQQIEVLTRAPQKPRRGLVHRGQRLNEINANYNRRMNAAIARVNLKRTYDEMLNEGNENIEPPLAPRRILIAPRHRDESLALTLPQSENQDPTHVELSEPQKKS